ncbi:MAG: hypothetical protein M1827_007538 [Pycnora praestabilis]|nr:MAG: hypothetical protein M1827_007538 [Pycnora praestabilis]
MASESDFITHNSDHTSTPDLRILHYNDVYHIEAGSQQPVGGIARFQTIVNSYRSSSRYADQSSLITVFSGDAFNPSLESSVTKGRHMVPVLNGIGTDVACVGNHDLDFGVPQFRHLASQCSFPWLLANVLDPGLGEDVALGSCQKTIITTSSNNIKVGIIGLVEREWLDTINSLPPNLIYKSASATAKELVPGLRKQGAEIIIAITHQREPNDLKLAEKTPKGLIDLILGGHDHFYQHHLVNGTHILRSGSDFKQLSYIEARRKLDGDSGWDFAITRRDVIREIPEDPLTVELVNNLTDSLKSKLEKPIGYTAAPLDGRFTTVRTRESNLGNWVCDLMRHYYDADCTIMAGGTIRGDQIYPPGVLRLKDIMECFPFEDPVIVIKVDGKAIWDALENAVCKVPALEGRFPQVSNIQFEFDPAAPEGSRMMWMKIDGKQVDLEKDYALATRGYMGRGKVRNPMLIESEAPTYTDLNFKDGFDSLLVRSEGGQAEEIVSEENGILISMILRQYFMSLKILGKWRRWGPSLGRHWCGVHERLHEFGGIKEPTIPAALAAHTHNHKHGSGKHPRHKVQTEVDGHLVDSDTDDESHSVGHVPPEAEEKERKKVIARMVSRKWMRLAGVKREHVGMVGEDEEDEFVPHWTRGICPSLEGRIIIRGSKLRETRLDSVGVPLFKPVGI